jgi:uncharacterized protein YebE (UPF0316 family)
MPEFGNEVLTMLYIFFARIIDVSIGTIRIILISRGYRKITPVLGFFEVLIWLTAVSKALYNLNGIHSYFIYAGGFAAGTYIGMLIESKLSIGYQYIRIITSKHVSALPLELRDEGYGVTIVDGMGMKGPVNILYTLAHKKDVKKIIDITNILEPNAFITIEDVKTHQNGYLIHKNFTNLIQRDNKKK